MKHRIRVAAIIESHGKLLLVEHLDGKGNRWWIPPGGGLEDRDKTILDCVRREVHEETGHTISVGNLKYIREFIEESNDTRHLELFYEAALSDEGLGIHPDSAPTLLDNMVIAAKWLAKEEINNLIVFPEILKDEYWSSTSHGNPIYLGAKLESLN